MSVPPSSRRRGSIGHVMETAVPEPAAAAPHADYLRPSRSRKRKAMVWIALALVALLVGGWLYWTRSTYHLETVEQGKLYRVGLQDFREFENALRQVKPKTIVSLIDDRETADPAKP